MTFLREPHELDPSVLSDHLEVLYRVARRLCEFGTLHPRRRLRTREETITSRLRRGRRYRRPLIHRAIATGVES